LAEPYDAAERLFNVFLKIGLFAYKLMDIFACSDYFSDIILRTISISLAMNDNIA
jgi:hypothetical protein